MTGRHWWGAGITIASAVVWSWVLLAEPAPWHRDTALVIAASLLVVVTVAVVAVLIESSRLGYRLLVAAAAVEAVVALLHRRSVPWYGGVAMLGVTSFVLADPSLGGWVRSRATAAPVPSKAVGLEIILLASPGITGLVTLAKPPGLLGALTAASWLALFVYARRLPGALLLARAGPPLLALGAIWIPPPGRWLWLALMSVATYLAASSEVRLAVRPLFERGSRLMIPPELAPEEIRRALGKDS
ncbi:MAG: hypothetical protein ACRDVK_06310 [Acidimicrobiia bacterium]